MARINISKFRRFALTMAAIGAINVGMGLAVRPPTKLSDMCAVDTTGNVVVDKVAEGTVTTLDHDYFVEEPGSNAVLLSRCAKGACAPLDPSYLNGHVGEPVRAEFCDQHAAKLTISDKIVFQLTQHYLDQNLEATQKNRNLMNTIGFFWVGFWLVLMGAMEIRARSQAA
ncbi:hypothetical protein [Burkholderia seminalis]|uniref:hypothetical protein n=1 Tax=Burkholderia seminalis TaxID=488731 RepID=UPI00158975B8|nr:hypothetical protein [Burkholderia seminalis]